MIMVDQGPHAYADPAVEELLVAFSVRSSKCVWSWDMGRGWQKEASRVGRLLVIPPNTESKWEVTGDRQILICAIPSISIKALLGEECPQHLDSAFAPLSHESRSDPVSQQLLLKVWESSGHAQGIGTIFAESALTAVISQLLLSASAISIPVANALPQWRLRRIADYVEENLHLPIGLMDLATIAGLGVRHFSRSFTQTMGTSPHRWLMEKRAERAKLLLCQHNMSLAEIAISCGFADQSHFTTCFRKATGVTPRAWRKAR